MWSEDRDEWDRYLAEYGHALETTSTPPTGRNPRSLAEWESYIWDELPETLSHRAPVYITQEELSNITAWKLKRGKWRPRLQALVNSNGDEAVREASADAFEKAEADPGAAIAALCELKGVGPATASAVLAIPRSDIAFMSDELLLAIPKMNGELKYTKKVFLTLLDESRKKASELGDDWSPKNVERACFAHARLGSLEQVRPAVAKETAKAKSLPRSQETTEENGRNCSSVEKEKVVQPKPVPTKRGRKPRQPASDGVQPSAAKKAKVSKNSFSEKSDAVEPKTMPSKRGRPAKGKGK